MIKKKFYLVFNLNDCSTIETGFKVVQNDVDAYTINAIIFDGDKPINYTLIHSATITYDKPDGKIVQRDMTIGENVITCVIKANEISALGVVKASIQLYGENDERLSLLPFTFEVTTDMISPPVVESTNEFPVLQKLVQDVNTIIPMLPEIQQIAFEMPGIIEFFDTAEISEAQRVASENTRQAQEAARQASIADIINQFNNLVTAKQQEAEVIIARDGEANLKARLDRDKQELSSQLADIANGMLGTKTENECIVTFIDDDFTNSIAQDWLFDLCQTKGIPFNVAVPGFMLLEEGNLAKLQDRKNAGWNICSHTRSHVNLTTIADDPSMLYDETTGYSEDLNALGFDGDIMVYPYGAVNDTVILATRQNHKIGVGSTEGINYTNSLRNLILKRVSGIGESNSSLEYCKSAVDEARKNGGWVIFKQHIKNDWTESTKQELIDLIDYILSQGIRIVTVRDGFEIKKNIIDVGGTENYVQIGRGGNLKSSELEKRNFLILSSMDGDGAKYNLTTPVTDYPYGVMRIYYRNIDLNTNMPIPANVNGGVVETHRPQPVIGNGDYGAFQVFFKYSGSSIYKRTWNVSDGKWNNWMLISRGPALPTNDRNNLFYNGLSVGDMVFDTDLGKPVFLKEKGRAEVDTLTILSAASSSGNITITLHRGGNMVVAVEKGDSPEIISDKIRDITIPNWSITGEHGSNVVIFTKLKPETSTTPTIDTGSTGVSATFERTIIGAGPVWIYANGDTV